MKKGIGPQGLGAPKSAAKMYGAKSPAKQAKPLSREKQFNPTTEFAPYYDRRGTEPETKPYLRKYQNAIIEPTTPTGYPQKAGWMEEGMHADHKFDQVMELRASGRKVRGNNFGIKKPKVNIK
jgi:hypothetical protein